MKGMVCHSAHAPGCALANLFEQLVVAAALLSGAMSGKGDVSMAMALALQEERRWESDVQRRRNGEHVPVEPTTEAELERRLQLLLQMLLHPSHVSDTWRAVGRVMDTWEWRDICALEEAQQTNVSTQPDDVSEPGAASQSEPATTLTEEQLARIAANRQAALERRRHRWT